MNRREFFGSLAAIVLVPFPAAAQRAGKVYGLGLFHVGLDHVPPSLEPLRATLKALGYEEQGNLRFDWRNLADERAAREVVRDFVAQPVDVIVAFENVTARAAKAATTTIPVVFVHVTDPVRDGFVKSLAHPGGNLTGFSGVGDAAAKEIELLAEAVPGTRRILVLEDAHDPTTARRLDDMRRTASRLKVTLLEREATDVSSIEHVLKSVKRGDVDGVIVASADLRSRFAGETMRLANTRNLPCYVHRKEWVQKGGFISYSPDLAAVGPLAAGYIDKILKGAKPADLPVQEFSQYELVINLKTAKALGVTVPQSLLARADQLIE